jgi:hypothetical protein
MILLDSPACSIIGGEEQYIKWKLKRESLLAGSTLTTVVSSRRKLKKHLRAAPT